MRRHFRRDIEGLAVRAEINVTSLVDLAFTLLIIFMITAPILQGGVEIQVPKAPTTPFTSSDEGLVISIDRDGQIYVEDTPVTMEEFQASIVQIIRRRGTPTVYVKGDANVPYGAVLRVIGTLTQSEIEMVNLVAQPEPPR